MGNTYMELISFGDMQVRKSLLKSILFVGFKDLVSQVKSFLIW